MGEVFELATKLEKIEEIVGVMSESLDPLQKMFGTSINFEVVNKSREIKTINEAIKDKSHVLIYFSAHWCPPCRTFTPQLANAYEKCMGDKNFEIIFLSSDHDENAFNE